MTRRVTPALALLGWLVTSHARAYQQPQRFADPVEIGGGGGRYFTGSPGDGFTCGVCHTKGTPTHLNITGLPPGSFQPGAPYTIAIDWDDSLTHIAFNAEVTDAEGKTAGQLTFLTPEELEPADKCEGAEFPAAIPMPAEDGRTVITAGECGATQARFHWVAPATAAGPLWFSGSLVLSDESGTVAGDQVTDFSQIIAPPAGARGAAVDVSGDCSVRGGVGGSASSRFDSGSAPLRLGSASLRLGLAPLRLGLLVSVAWLVYRRRPRRTLRR